MQTHTHADTVHITIIANDRGNPPGKLADAELHFSEGPLAGLKLIGFGVWECRGGAGRSVTLPARQYAVNGERRSFAFPTRRVAVSGAAVHASPPSRVRPTFVRVKVDPKVRPRGQV
jgi:hypothetical protein